MGTPSHLGWLRWLLAPVLIGLLVAFIFLCLRLKSPLDSPAPSATPVYREPSPLTSGAGLFRRLENDYPLKLPLVEKEAPAPRREEKPGPALPPPQTPKIPEPVKSEPALNRQTDNLNVLFLGVDGQELLMCALYTVNHRGSFRSAALFFPTQGVLPGSQETIAQVFSQRGVEGVRKLVEEQMGITVAYYIRIEQAVFDYLEEFIDPIYVDGEKIDLSQLFTMGVGSKDQEILAELWRQLTRPRVFFLDLPRLVFHRQKLVTTDFAVTPPNLLLHFKIVQQVDASQIKKVVLPTQRVRIGHTYRRQLLSYPLQNAVYLLTK